MVSKITTGYPTDEQGRPYRRRRYAPAIIVVVTLMILGVVVWAMALGGDDSESVPTACNQPSPPTAVEAGAAPPPPAPRLDVVDRGEMLDVAPAPLATFGVRVLNASDERGAARSVSEDLTAQGFTPVPDTPFADDPLYPNQDLDCVAQIRFGPAGRAAAAATWLAFPCAQLVEDGRRGTAVDVALGAYHSGHELSQDAQAALEALRSADPTNPNTGVDPVLVKAVHSGPC
ncbi:envelope integrity protein Cei [Gordonia sp. zg691]|uniref:Envelope integrity protein Cei n=1 Tax=Gordonia jinghuaiqii TaxID=2758710 RepID=A0A7D7M147_9ACTN|nr:envelope integrity protein Cei [Gordonia jinghuaiqii]MBD0861397.1 envelope integrity protein Cei [Gordonia jinghuaiqii]MCR5976297.1 envelope integrity protein Cei [Gordonia jinghuaiqii]QMT03516.1 envelope integrity protein Cei [Gordonia jinghuaiqii]